MLLKYFEITNAFNREMPESMVKNEQTFLKWNKMKKKWFTRVLIQFDIWILIWTRKKHIWKMHKTKCVQRSTLFPLLSLSLKYNWIKCSSIHITRGEWNKKADTNERTRRQAYLTSVDSMNPNSMHTSTIVL